MSSLLDRTQITDLLAALAAELHAAGHHGPVAAKVQFLLEEMFPGPPLD